MKKIIRPKNFITVSEATEDCLINSRLVVLVDTKLEEVYFLKECEKKYTWTWVYATGADCSWGIYDSIKEAITSALDDGDHNIYLFDNMADLLKNVHIIGVLEDQ